MPALWGSLLGSLANSYTANNRLLEDQDFQRQQRAQQLAAEQLANQSSALQVQQQQNALNQDQAQAGYLTSAAQNDNGGQQPQQQQPPQQSQPAGGASTLANAASTAPGTSNPLSAPVNGTPMTAPTGGLPATEDGKVGGKPMTPFLLSVMKAESNGLAAATSTKGAQGTMQVMGSTAASPGYGVRPAKDNSPAELQRVGVDYAQAMLQRYGGDTSLAAAAYNAGPARVDAWIAAGKPATGPGALPTETVAYVQKVAGGLSALQQQQKQQQGVQQAVQQPSPADQIAARESAGADTPVTAYHGAASAQDKLIGTYRAAAQNAYKAGDVRSAAALSAKADAMAGQQVELQAKALDVQEKVNKAVATDFLGVHDQETYDTALAGLGQNPAMRAAVSGLGLTGSYEADRNKIGSLVARTETLKDQQANGIAQQRLQIDKQKEQREQAKQDAPKIAAAQQQQAAQQQDDARRQQAAQSGMPFVPSIASTAPPGTTPQQIAEAKKTIDKKWTDYDKGHETQRTSSQNVANLAGQFYTTVKNNPGLVGGWTTTLRDAAGNWALNADQQILVKTANSMIVEAQKMAAPGAQRSAATAAYAKILATTKPNITMSPDAALKVANDYYMMSAAQTAQNEWMDRARQANPDAPPEVLALQWRRYETALGASQFYDPATKSMRPNAASVPTLPDGTPNPTYRSPDEFFAHEGAKK